jgi:hypothetical protein
MGLREKNFCARKFFVKKLFAFLDVRDTMIIGLFGWRTQFKEGLIYRQEPKG